MVGPFLRQSAADLFPGMAALSVAASSSRKHEGILRLPVGKGRHSPIAAEDQGRAIAAILKNPEGLIGQTINLSGPVEMDHEQMAAELTEALGRKIVFEDLPVDVYCKSLQAMSVPPYILQHLSGAMEDDQHGAMSGADNNIEKLTGKKPMSVGDFARAHLDQLNPKKRLEPDMNQNQEKTVGTSDQPKRPFPVLPTSKADVS
jgi:hypothetical protein